MQKNLKVGIIGDYNPDSRYHSATDAALGHAAQALSISLIPSWISTQLLTIETAETTLKPFDALLCAPGSPYISMDGALLGIKFARERGWPFMGT